MANTSKKRKLASQVVEETYSNGEVLERSSDGFVKGSIVRLKLENFVTYDSVEFRPGPYLNVIIGPNGTGKSTIVCAICLSLAGKTSLLGRAQHPAEYIKHGCNKAMVEIELFNPNGGGNYVIKREITKKGTSWWINRKSCAQKTVEELVTELNIQVGNLCQFLPQDRVADFAKMSQQELLENTEKAVGPPNMFENHNKLKTARAKEREYLTSFTRVKERLEQEQSLNSRLEQDVKNYEERQRHLEKIRILKMKRPWVEYEDKRKLFQSEKERRDGLADDVKKARAQNAPLQQKREQAKKKVDKMATEMKGLSDQVRDHARQAAQKSKDIENQTEQLAEAMEELNSKKQEEAQRRRKLKEYHDQLKLLQNDLNSINDEEDVQPALDKCNQDMRESNKEMTQTHHRAEQIKGEVNNTKREVTGLQSELKKIQDVSNRRLEELRRRHKDTYSAVIWLRSNKHRFKSTIYEPIMTVVNAKDPQYTKYLECHISFNDMKVFICEDEDDVALFLSLCRDEQNLKVNAAMAPPQPVSAFRPQYPVSRYKRYGFYSYLRELFDCPDGVMRFLCLQYKVHQIPVGNANTKTNVEQVIATCPELNNFYTENHQYSLRKSRYRDVTSSRCTELKRPTLLTVIADTSREDQIKRALQEKQDVNTEKSKEYQELQAAYKQVDSRMNQLRNEKKRLQDQKNQKRTLVQKIQMKSDSIKRVEGDAINLPAEEAKINQKLRQINVKKVKYLTELKDHTRACLVKSKDKVRMAIGHATAMRTASALEAQLREQSVSLQNLEREFEQLKERVKLTKEEAKKLLDIAKKATSTHTNEELSPELKRAFETCPAILEEIDAAIHEQQARADCTFHTDESVIQEYKRRKKDISVLKEEVVQQEEALKNHGEEIEQIKSAWLEPLQELISRINHNFSFFFRAMNCAGEVDLKVPDPPDDYEKYGVRIKVKYRDSETLQELTPARQSGGERSVATVLYMMALQELTRVPFRCVDEINQGMDPVNERKVFELVVKTACRENTSQYFLLTPKLLPDLEYSDNMTVLCVYNGSYMMDHTEWNLRKFLRRRANLD